MVFEPKEHLRKIQQKDYLDTSWRIVWFKEVHPNGRIETEPFTVGSIVYMKAFIFDAENKLLATGSATVRDARQHEATWAGRIIEKAETAAIGRALAHAGFGTQFTGENDDDNLADSPKDNAGKSQQKQGNQRQAANQNKPAQGKPDKSESLDPDDHLGKKDAKAPILFKTKPIVYIETKAGEFDKNYMVAGGFTLFAREPFRQLGYDEDVINQLGVIGKHKLLPEEAFIIVYRKEGNKSIPVKMIVVATEQFYDFK